MSEINWTLIQQLATKPHKHFNIAEDCEFTCLTHKDDHWTGKVVQEARTVQHLCDMAGVPEGEGYNAHIDARVYLLLVEVQELRERLSRIAKWYSLETGPHGAVGLYCIECGERHPCDSHKMAIGVYNEEEET